MRKKDIARFGLIILAAFPLHLYSQVSPAPVGQPPASPAPVAAKFSPGVAEVVKLAASGVGDDVVVAYDKSSQSMYNLSADDILHLKDAGLAVPVMAAMLNHDNSLRSQRAQYTFDQKIYPPSTPPQPAPSVAQAPVQPGTPPQSGAAQPSVSGPPATVSTPPASAPVVAQAPVLAQSGQLSPAAAPGTVVVTQAPPP